MLFEIRGLIAIYFFREFSDVLSFKRNDLSRF